MQLPKVIFGTSGLGNLYQSLPDGVKYEIIKESMDHTARPAVFDSAGKYGAGLALESLGKFLSALNVPKQDVLISNKLGWLRTELITDEPTFEPGVWKNLEYDAVQNISYDGILECYEQGNKLLNGYRAELVSVHDPDEYLMAAADDKDRARRYNDIIEAYGALADLKSRGEIKTIGVGAKDWKVIKQITNDVQLDWIMIANSLTIHNHPADLIAFMRQMEDEGIAIINSAVFNGGFLTGGDFYNYKPINPYTTEGKTLYNWRQRFIDICLEYSENPAVVCVKFGLSAPGVTSVALSTTNPGRVKQNVAMANTDVSPNFWRELVKRDLIDPDYLPLLLKKYQ